MQSESETPHTPQQRAATSKPTLTAPCWYQGKGRPTTSPPYLVVVEPQARKLADTSSHRDGDDTMQSAARADTPVLTLIITVTAKGTYCAAFELTITITNYSYSRRAA